MIYKREIFGGKELIDFFCKVSVESDKEYCRYVVNFENKSLYNGSYTSYEDGDILYDDLLNPNIKWNVTFDKHSKLLLFKNGDKYVEFDGVDYDYAKDFFEAKEK